MSSDLGRPFLLKLWEDSLAPEFQAGGVGRFEPATTRAPSPGRPVLVKDSADNFYVRDYVEGIGGRWRAEARTRGFLPLDSQDHGLTLVAVMRGYDWP